MNPSSGVSSTSSNPSLVSDVSSVMGAASYVARGALKVTYNTTVFAAKAFTTITDTTINVGRSTADIIRNPVQSLKNGACYVKDIASSAKDIASSATGTDNFLAANDLLFPDENKPSRTVKQLFNDTKNATKEGFIGATKAAAWIGGAASYVLYDEVSDRVDYMASLARDATTDYVIPAMTSAFNATSSGLVTGANVLAKNTQEMWNGQTSSAPQAAASIGTATLIAGTFGLLYLSAKTLLKADEQRVASANKVQNAEKSILAAKKVISDANKIISKATTDLVDAQKLIEDANLPLDEYLVAGARDTITNNLKLIENATQDIAGATALIESQTEQAKGSSWGSRFKMGGFYLGSAVTAACAATLGVITYQANT